MNILNWLITSSADPKKTSLMVKGAIVLGGSQLVRLFDMACSFGLSCLAVDLKFVNQLAEGVDAIVYGGLILWGGVWFLYGIGRKFYLARWAAKE
jgi:hypothetical protein